MMRHIARLRRWLQRSFEDFKENEAGAIPLFMGLSIMAVMGFAGLGIDSANWYAEKRVTQNIADSAAIAATHVFLEQDGADGYQTLMNQDALSAAIENGYDNVSGNTITVTELTTTGTNGLIPVVEVVISHEVPAYFAGILMDFQPRVSARAVGGLYFTGTHCVIGLDPDEPKTVYFTGNAEVTVSCGVSSNADDPNSLVVDGNAYIDAATATAVGEVVVKGNGTLTAEDSLISNHHPEALDPFETTTLQTGQALGCDYGAAGETYTVSPSDSVTIGMGEGDYPALQDDSFTGGGAFKFCGDVDIRGDLTLASGTYYLHSGELKVNSGASLTCDGCTIVMTGSAAEGYGDIRINGGSVVDISAPAIPEDSVAVNPYTGIAFYKDRLAPEDGVNLFNGDSGMTIDGAVYIPSQEVEYSGGTSGIPACNMLVARMIKFTGNVVTSVQADEGACAAFGFDDQSAAAKRIVVLVE